MDGVVAHGLGLQLVHGKLLVQLDPPKLEPLRQRLPVGTRAVHEPARFVVEQRIEARQRHGKVPSKGHMLRSDEPDFG